MYSGCLVWFVEFIELQSVLLICCEVAIRNYLERKIEKLKKRKNNEGKKLEKKQRKKTVVRPS